MFQNFICYPFFAGPLRAPKWYKRPVGASFGFGGKIVSFQHTSAGSEVDFTGMLPVSSAMMHFRVHFPPLCPGLCTQLGY